MDRAIWAEWSQSYLQIHIYVPDKHNLKKKKVDQIYMDDSMFVDDCTTIFHSDTVTLLGNDAQCVWIKTKNAARLQSCDENVVLLVNLAPTSTIIETDPIIFLDIPDTPLKYICTTTNVYAQVIIPYIFPPFDPYPPQIILTDQSTAIGKCDDLELDARATTFMGGRDNGIFQWGVTHQNKNKKNLVNYYFGPHIIIGNKLLFNKLELYDLSLTVTNWYNETSMINFDVLVSEQAIPKVSVSGTHIYKATRVHMNGYIDIFARIDFNKECLSNDAPDIMYTLSWSAKVVKIYNDSMVIDTAMLSGLNQYLQTQNDIDAFDVYAEDYMQPGLIYYFTVNLVCIGGFYNCDINATHDLMYDYAELKCQISGSDIYLDSMDPSIDFNALVIKLNGNRLTWDPDHEDKGRGTTLGKDHLVWNWECYDAYTNSSCDYLINDNSKSVINLDLSAQQWAELTDYSFEFVMEVYDSANAGRETCSDVFVLDIETTVATIIPVNTTPNPTIQPNTSPTLLPTINPSQNPTITPTTNPSQNPSENPSVTPTLNPSEYPSQNPSVSPTLNPSQNPSENPSVSPTLNPSEYPSQNPSVTPTSIPTRGPTTTNPTQNPVTSPVTSMPTETPSQNPSQNPSLTPTSNPSESPSQNPSQTPSQTPTQNPSVTPSETPSQSPITPDPTTAYPTLTPSARPTADPTTASPTRDIRRKRFIVQVTAVQTRVNVRHRANLIGDIINYDKSKLRNMYYEWSEMNGLLSAKDFENYNENADNNSYNLVLKPNVLQSGLIYTFKLVARQYRIDSNETVSVRRRLAFDPSMYTEIGYGESQGIDIYMYKVPIMREFMIEPSCVDHYQDIHHLLSEQHTLTLAADDEYVPLSYQFGYIDNITQYFHPSLLVDSSISDIYLFIGDFTVFGNVINDLAAVSSRYINCSIGLIDYSKCITNWKDHIEAYIEDREEDLSFDENDKYAFIFQQTNTYLKYLSEYYDPTLNSSTNMSHCVEESIEQIIEVLDEYITNNTCEMSKWTIIQSDTMSLLLDLIYLYEYDTFYGQNNNYLAMLQQLLYINLDPCGCIRNLRDAEELSVSSVSVTTQIPSIYYFGKDITHCLSPIISDPDYQHLLCMLSPSIISHINSIQYNASLALHNLLLNAIYIKERVSISTAIPGTQICGDCIDVEMCTLRIDTTCDEEQSQIALDFEDTFIHIPNDIFCNYSETDITVIGMPGAAMEIVENEADQASVDCVQSKVIENGVLITISNGNISNDSASADVFDRSHLIENIIYTVPCDGDCDDSYECVWFDTLDETWQNSGCNTSINMEFNDVTCECSHLTAFATTHNIYDLCENPFSMGWLSSDLWDILIWIFFTIFMLIFLYSMWSAYRYHYSYHWRALNIFGVFLVGITALLYAMVCLFGYLTKQTLLTTTNQERQASQDMIKLYTLFLLLPQVTYFMIFAIIFYSWFLLVHEIFVPDVDIEKRRRNLKYVLIAGTILLWLFLITYYILVLTSKGNIFLIGGVIWAILITSLCVVFIIYTFLVNKVLYKTYKSMLHLLDSNSNKYGARGVNVLLIMNIFIMVYFIFLAFTSIYFVINPSEHQTVGYMVMFYIVDIFFLLFLLYMFRDFLHKNEKTIMIPMKDTKSEPLSPGPHSDDIEMRSLRVKSTSTSPSQNNYKGFDAFAPPTPGQGEVDDSVPKLGDWSSAPAAVTAGDDTKPKPTAASKRMSEMLLTENGSYDHSLVMRKLSKAKDKREEEQLEEMTREIIEQDLMEQAQEDIELTMSDEKNEERERLEKERLERETLRILEEQSVEKERLEKLEEQRLEKERLAKLEQERMKKLEEERAAKELEKLENERLQKLENERLEKERLKKLEAERLEKEERMKKLEEERVAKELEKLEMQLLENERLQKLENERLEREKKEKERLQKLEQERLQKLEEEIVEKERLKKLEAERLEKQRLAELEQEHLEQERLQKLEEERLQKESEQKEDTNEWPSEESDDELPELKDEKTEHIEDLVTMELPKEVEAILGNRSEFKLPKQNGKAKQNMERDLRKLIFSENDNKDDIRHMKLAILKFYDILIATFRKYCKIGGDSDWLTLKGWDALCADAFIPDKKLDKCTEKQCHALFNIIYRKHNRDGMNMTLRRSQILQKKHNKFSTKTLILSEWNDSDPWTGLWVSDNDESEEIYKIKQIGDKKLKGFIKSFEFCDIDGSIKGVEKTKAEMITFWHSGARKNKRRMCKCTLNKPEGNDGKVTMTVKWKSIPISQIIDQISTEKGEYLMTKMEKQLSNADNAAFKGKIGLCRHEYLDAMLCIAQMKFSQFGQAKFANLTKLCEDQLIPFIWGGMENAQEVTIKQIFRPFSTELHRLFDRYCEGSKLLSCEEWKELCLNVLKQDKNAFRKGGKPTEIDISSSYELAKEGYDLELTYKLFEMALRNLTHKLYKRQPKAKYVIMKYPDKLKKLLKWCAKLEKSSRQ